MEICIGIKFTGANADQTTEKFQSRGLLLNTKTLLNNFRSTTNVQIRQYLAERH